MQELKKKIRVGIIFGGKSAEHEISLLSAKNIVEALDKEVYEPILIGIDKSGRWRSQIKASIDLSQDSLQLDETGNQIALLPESHGRVNSFDDMDETQKLDVVFPILHGPFGEDGTIQGLLKLANIPFVGASVLGSAVGMDKDIMKRLLRDADIPIADYISLKLGEKVPEFEEVTAKLGNPLFLKPANLGSSVGINKVRNAAEYVNAIEEAFQYDNKIIIEEFIKGREIECAVLGNENPKASLPGEVVANHDFYSYEAKYLDNDGAAIQIPADLPENLISEVQEIAIKTFKVLDCEGLGRVDVFITEDNRVLVNEINTMPGFTKISMYPMMWVKSGLPYSKLIDELIQLAFDRFKKEERLKTGRE